MNARALVILIAGACVTISACKPKPKAAQVDWTVYDDAQIKLKYPAGWRFKIAQLPPDGFDVTISTPRENDDSDIISITAQPKGKIDDDIDHRAKRNSEHSLNADKIVVEKVMLQGKIDARRYPTHHPGPFLDMPSAPNTVKATFDSYENLTFIKDGHLYELDTTLPNRDPEFYRSIFRQIVDSIEFKDPPPGSFPQHGK